MKGDCEPACADVEDNAVDFDALVVWRSHGIASAVGPWQISTPFPPLPNNADLP